ncbi:MAG: NAD-dependent epimerase/dehydratase family protein [Geminicoccaceae bacterium]|nr:NAD-dependent epimerase/dehydratase family protein [Geminicoccaceae bacterium]
MKALVTGATGFVGSALVRRLLDEGHHVRAFVRTPSKLGDLGLSVDETVQGDITDPAAVDRAVQGVDVVFAIAGTFREPNLGDDAYRAINVEAVRHIVEAAARHGVRRVVHCSTVGIHGNVVGDPFTEAAPLCPDGIYEETKAEGDSLALDLGRKLGVEVVVIRPTPVYGPGDTRLLKLFKMASKKRMVMLGSGEAGYHLVHVDDLADAFLRAATAEGVAGEAFIVGGPERPTLNEVVATIAGILGQDDQKVVRLPAAPVRLLAHACELACRPVGLNPPLYRRRVDFFINDRRYDTTKARERLGFTPKVTMREGLAGTARWYRGQGLLPERAG